MFLHLTLLGAPAALRRSGGVTDRHFSHTHDHHCHRDHLSTPFFSSQMSYRQVWTCHPGSPFQYLHWHNHTVHLLFPLSTWYLNFSSPCIFLAFIFSNSINILFGARVISNPILIYIIPALSNFCDFTHFRIISEFNSLLHSYHYPKKN